LAADETAARAAQLKEQKMKTKSPLDTKSILAALAKMHVYTFTRHSGDPKRNAQRNLDGKTHYVDDDTLRWHKSRIVGSGTDFDGLLFHVVGSDALDMHNTRRGFRYAVFDVFGTCVSRPDLESAVSTSAKAYRQLEELEFDVAGHYQTVFAEMLNRNAETAKEIQEAIKIAA
jgi:hypothetical protein